MAALSRPGLFISYRHSQSAAVGPAVSALEAAGVRCFFDVKDIDALADFPDDVRRGIDASHAMVVWWSADYADSDHCLAEFRRAWQHARRQGSDVGRRIWIVNPEPTAAHIWAGELNAQNFLRPPTNEAIDSWARTLAERLEALLPEGPLAIETGASPPPTLYNVPVPSARFTGRGVEMLRIHTAFFPARIGATTAGRGVCLYGMGGLGKSELATRYARDFAQAYPGGVFWISLANFLPSTPLEEDDAERAGVLALVDTFAREPGLRDRLLLDNTGRPLAPTQARTALAEWLATAPPYLWILDNVPPMSPLDSRMRVLESWRAPTAAGRTLITTRDARVPDGYAGVPLEPLALDDAMRLMARFRPVTAIEQESAAALVAEVGRHTLALMLLGERVRRDGDYGATLRAVRDAGALTRLEQIAGRLRADLGAAARSVVGTFDLSIAPLSADARRLLGLAALCAPNEAIPRELIRGAFGGDAAGDDFADAIDALLAASLLAERRGDDAVDIHPLVADVSLQLLAAPQTTDNVAQAVKRLAEALLGMMSPERVLKPRGWPLMAVCEPHTEQLLRYMATAQPREDFLDHTAALSWVLARLHLARGEASKARELVDWALVACSLEGENGARVIPIARPEVRRLLKTLTTAHAMARDLDTAVGLQRPFVTWLNENRPPNDDERLVESDNLADILRQRGGADDLAEARSIYEQTLPVWRQRDPDSRDTLTVLNNLALVERELGHKDRAVALFKEVLTGLDRHDGMEVETLSTEFALADLLLSDDPRAASERLASALLKAVQMGFPDTHPLLRDILHRVGAAAHRLADWPTACTALGRALPAYAATQGDRDPATIAAAWALFDAALHNGDTATADEVKRQYLQWLSEQPDAALSDEQRGIRADVERRMPS